MSGSMLRAGVAREIISPPEGIYLIGYGNRSQGNAGVHDDLTATALVLDDGHKAVAIVACDLLCLNEFTVDRIRAQVGRGVEVILCCSHTHSGPIVYAGRLRSRQRRAYVDALVARVVQAVRRAVAGSRPADLAWAAGEADTAVNRRERQPDGSVAIGVNPEGPVDRSIGILQVRRAGGEPLATVVNYACHGTVLGPENLLVSADWVGPMRARVEAEMGGYALFLQGATGDMNPVSEWAGLKSWELVQALGERVGERALAACAGGLNPVEGSPVDVARREVWLPLEAKVESHKPPHSYRRPLLREAGLPQALGLVADVLLEWRYPWRSRIEPRDGRWQVPLRVSAVRVGEVALVTFGAETFTEIGQAVKAAAPAKHALFASVTDGCIGYLPTAKAHSEGGYEVNAAPFFYRYPGRLAPECAALATAAAEEAMTGLWRS